MELNFHANTEAILRQRAADAGLPVEDFVLHALQFRLELDSEPEDQLGNQTWETEFREWAASHPCVEHFVDDSRESIYEGRGL